MNVLLKQREVAYYLEDSGARLLFAWHGFADQARAGADEAGAECILVEPRAFAERSAAEPMPGRRGAHREDGDTAVILYTSGTTGQAQGRRAHARQPERATPTVAVELLDDQRRATSSSARCRCSTRSGRRAALNAAVQRRRAR